MYETLYSDLLSFSKRQVDKLQLIMKLAKSFFACKDWDIPMPKSVTWPMQLSVHQQLFITHDETKRYSH